MVAIVAVASILTIFSLMFTKTLWSDQTFQSKLITADQTAANQLNANSKAADQLETAYNNFENKTTNIIGGSNTGTGSNQGDNAKIVLDALPSQYDFPALASSIQKITSILNIPVTSITGTDNESTQANVAPSANPVPVAIPFSFTVSDSNYGSIKNLLTLLEESIRPIQILNLQISGSENSMNLSVQAQTYYQSGKIMSISKETIN